jgi:transposase
MAPSPGESSDDAIEPFFQLRLHFTDDAQTRYEIVRPLLIGHATSATERAHETQTHPQTVRRYVRRFEREGMRGLFDHRLFNEDQVRAHGRTISDAVRHEVIRLKTLYPPLHQREIASIVFATLGTSIDHKAVARILKAQPPALQKRMPFTKFHDYKNPYEARVEVINLYYQGWNIQSISGFLGVSRRHVYRLLERFESEMFAGLQARPSGTKTPQRKLYLPLLKKIADMQREYPLIGRFRLWDQLRRDGVERAEDISQSTVRRAMAFNRMVCAELSQEKDKKPPRLHPYKSRTWHQFWFIDHRYLVKIDGIQYYSLCILEGYPRAFLAGVVLATQTRGPVLKLLHEAVSLWGTPGTIVSDRGGAFISTDYQRTCARLGIEVDYIEPHQSWQNMIETHFNIQRRLGDPLFERAKDEDELQQAHMQFMEIYNSSEHLAHQKRKVGRRTPQAVLAWVRGRLLSPRQISHAFRETLWNRKTNKAGYVLVQNYYLYAERALSRQRVCLWLWDDTLSIDHRDELLASYPCAYDAEQHHIKKLGEPTLHENRFAHQQPQLLQLAPKQWQRVSQRQVGQRRRTAAGRAQLRLPGI